MSTTQFKKKSPQFVAHKYFFWNPPLMPALWLTVFCSSVINAFCRKHNS